MEDQTGIAALRQVLPPDLGADEHIDWQAAEARWGTRFPRDYMAFMSVYGVGSIGSQHSIGEVGIDAPLPTESPLWPHGDLQEETENARATWEDLGGQEGLDIEPEHILAWGNTSGADILCWLTTDPDPDQWPVLIFDRQMLLEPFTIFRCGMVEFLRKLLLGELDSYGMEFRPVPRFVHWRVAESRSAGRSELYAPGPGASHRR
ncbi:SMI1/KNR4 family protein [Streptomyces flaveolus]|uniref:SMI1/KNR4 family protein n=1 Tax=Streptomyces flaveolus TaxID=67297 RepID=UPI00344238B6